MATPRGPAATGPRCSATAHERLEALLWNVEKDPYLSSELRQRHRARAPARPGALPPADAAGDVPIPRLHQRVVPGLGRLAPPEWHDDPDFDIDYHVRHLAPAPPGSLAELLDLAVRFVQDPLDRSRPLWSFTVIDGLEGGRAPLVQKMHHTITDGEGRSASPSSTSTWSASTPRPAGPDPAGPSGGGSPVELDDDTLADGWRRASGSPTAPWG